MVLYYNKGIAMRSIRNCLNKQLTELCQRSVQLEELSNKVEGLLSPELAAACCVGSFNKGCLILGVSDANWASQLRFALPELRDALRASGLYQLSSIKVCVNGIHTTYKKPKKVMTKSLSNQAKALIIRESQVCDYQPLKTALLDLAK